MRHLTSSPEGKFLSKLIKTSEVSGGVCLSEMTSKKYFSTEKWKNKDKKLFNLTVEKN
jgi:hypothetical protein